MNLKTVGLCISVIVILASTTLAFAVTPEESLKKNFPKIPPIDNISIQKIPNNQNRKNRQTRKDVLDIMILMRNIRTYAKYYFIYSSIDKRLSFPNIIDWYQSFFAFLK